MNITNGVIKKGTKAVANVPEAWVRLLCQDWARLERQRCMARVDYLVGKIGIEAHSGRKGHRHVSGNACTEELPSIASLWCRA